MTPAQARAIDRQEFEAEAAALRQRAYALVRRYPSQQQDEQPKRGRPRTTYTVNGVTRSLREWAEASGIPYATLSSRIHTNGWSMERAITTPIQRGRPRKVQ